MFRALLLTASIVIAAASTGCVGMGHGGLGAGLPCHCGDCDGCGDCGVAGPGHGGPFTSLRNWRRNLVCGGGCGEIYYGDWINHGPDCCDACDNQVAVVGPHRRVRPLRTTARFLTGLYGVRYCDDCSMSMDECCCDSGCDAGCDGGCASCGGMVSNSVPTDAMVISKGVKVTPTAAKTAAKEYYDVNAAKIR